MSIRKGNDIIASKPLIDAVPTQDSTNAVSSGGVYTALQSKQDTISDLATIRSGAAAGATAVQPATLATVATTGLYSDLSGKPTIPTTLAALTGDVNITSPTNKQHLVYDGNDQKWKNTTSLALENTATATDALTILGVSNTSWTNGINIGKDSRINSTNGVAIGVDASADVNAVGVGRDTDAGVRGTAIGAYAKTSADTGIAIGCWNSNTNNAVSSAKGAYQFGVGTNSTARTMNVGWYDDSVTPSTFRNYQLLDGNTGLIPDARISTNIARTTDLNNKVDVDASNFDTTGKSTVAGLAMPSDTYENLTPVHNTTYTAPANGFYSIASSSDTSITLVSNNTDIMRSWTGSYSAVFMPVKKGATIRLEFTGTPSFFRFIYAEGEV